MSKLTRPSKPKAKPTLLALPELAQRINAHHAQVEAAVASGIEHAIAAGKLLLQAKASLRERGEQWLPWLDMHCDLSVRTAQVYMRLAKRAPKGPNTQRAAFTSIRQALEAAARPKTTTVRYTAFESTARPRTVAVEAFDCTAPPTTITVDAEPVLEPARVVKVTVSPVKPNGHGVAAIPLSQARPSDTKVDMAAREVSRMATDLARWLDIQLMPMPTSCRPSAAPSLSIACGRPLNGCWQPLPRWSASERRRSAARSSRCRGARPMMMSDHANPGRAFPTANPARPGAGGRATRQRAAMRQNRRGYRIAWSEGEPGPAALFEAVKGLSDG